jgi:hypothetical protein
MLRVVGLLLGVPAVVAGVALASGSGTLSLSLIEAFLTAAFIIGFAVAAADRTIRRNI